MLVLSLAYLALPLWLPLGWIARQLANQLALDFKRPVTVDHIEVGWIKGVIIHDLTVIERPGWPNPALVRIEQVHCAFAPLTMLFKKRLPQMDIIAPHLWLVIDEQGRLNIDDLDESRPGRRLPSLNYRLSDIVCHVQISNVTQSFKIDRLTCRLDPQTGNLRLFSEAQVDRPRAPGSIGRFVFAAQILVPRLRRDVKLDGEVSLEWTDLSLADLPVPLATRLPVEQVDGLSSGRLKLNTRPDLDIDFDLSLNLKGVKIVRPDMPHPVNVPDATLSCNGHWDPITEELYMNDFEYLTPAIHIHRLTNKSGPVMAIDRGGQTPFLLHLGGRVRDWLALRHEFPEIDAFTRYLNTDLSGQADFSFVYQQQRARDLLQVTVEAGKSRWHIPHPHGDYLNVSAGVSKNLFLEMTHDRSGPEILMSTLVLDIGQCRLSADNQWTVAPPDPLPGESSLNPLRWLSSMHSRLTFQTHDMRDLPLFSPFLARFEGTERWQGPLKLAVLLQPRMNAPRLEVTLTMDEESTFALGHLFNKPPGKALSFNGGLQPPSWDSTRLNNFGFDLRVGSARLALNRDQTRIEYTFNNATSPSDPQAVNIEARSILPLRLENVQELLDIFPVARKALRLNTANRLVGSAEIICSSHFSYRPADWLLCNEIAFIADQLDIQWGHWLNKPAGAPLTVTGAYQLRDLDNQWEHLARATIARPTGLLTASALFAHSESDSKTDDVEHLRLEAELSDIADWFDLSPVLDELCRTWDPRGACRFQAESLLLNDRQKVALAIDATSAEWNIPGQTPIHKPTGMPAEAHLNLVANCDPSESNRRVWKLVRGDARMGGLLLDDLGGMIVLSTPSHASLTGQREWSGRPVIQSAHLRTAGQILFNDPLVQMHPRIADFCRQISLAGSAGWETLIEITPQTVNLVGLLDAHKTEFCIPLPTPALSELHKLPSIPAVLSYNVTMDHGDPTGAQIHIHELALNLTGNTISTDGLILLDDLSTTPSWPHAGRIALRADLTNPHGLLAMLPRNEIHVLDGALRAQTNLSFDPDGLQIGDSRLRFDNFAIALSDEPVRLNGRLVRGPAGRVDLIDLQGTWGPSCLTLSGQVYPPGHASESYLGIRGPNLDITDLRHRLESLPQLRLPITNTQPTGKSNQLRELFAILGQMNLNAYACIDTLRLILPPDVSVSTDAVVQYLTLHNGQANLQFRSLLDGGFVSGELKTNVLAADPLYHLTYEARQIPPGPVTESYLDKMFIGMTASGPLTLIDETYQKFFPAPGELNHEVGRGELIIEGGIVEGRAAPLWMTNVFPRLNLAQFDFSYMHSWFEKFRDGTVRHQIIYQGRYYNIYSVGNNYPDRRMDYEVGIDFMADFDSQYWTESGQGRIPLFRKTGYLRDDGSLADEVVTYVPQRFIWNILTRNNPVFTIYHAIRKRILGEP